MSFKKGDIVQVTKYVDMPSADNEMATVPHPFYSMIGIVCNDRYADSVKVFFPGSWVLEPDKYTDLSGSTGSFSPDELTKIGTTAVEIPYDRINLINQEKGTRLIENFNKIQGTSFQTLEEFLNHIRRRSKGQT